MLPLSADPLIHPGIICLRNKSPFSTVEYLSPPTHPQFTKGRNEEVGDKGDPSPEAHPVLSIPSHKLPIPRRCSLSPSDPDTPHLFSQSGLPSVHCRLWTIQRPRLDLWAREQEVLRLCVSAALPLSLPFPGLLQTVVRAVSSAGLLAPSSLLAAWPSQMVHLVIDPLANKPPPQPAHAGPGRGVSSNTRAVRRRSGQTDQ